MDNNLVKKKILENAKEILEKEGLKGLTVQNLIEKCSIGKTTFYKQFQTKKDLLR
jgi:AcrR family transcriptional regulator